MNAQQDIRISEHHNELDFVVASGAYDPETGQQRTAATGVILGSVEKVKAHQEKIRAHMLRVGGLPELSGIKPKSSEKPVKSSKKKSTKTEDKKAVEQETIAALPIIPQYQSKPAQSPSDVYEHKILMENELGSFTLAVEGYMENDVSVMLVFSNQDKCFFKPKAETKFQLTLPGSEAMTVYHAGMEFTWLDDQKYLLLLLKTT